MVMFMSDDNKFEYIKCPIYAVFLATFGYCTESLQFPKT